MALKTNKGKDLESFKDYLITVRATRLPAGQGFQVAGVKTFNDYEVEAVAVKIKEA